jgi:hypothetical protein
LHLLYDSVFAATRSVCLDGLEKLGHAQGTGRLAGRVSAPMIACASFFRQDNIPITCDNFTYCLNSELIVIDMNQPPSIIKTYIIYLIYERVVAIP